MNKKLIVLLIAAAALEIFSSPYVDLIPRYNRLTSNVMARKIECPSLANLDYAAYNANPVLAEREVPRYKRPARQIALDSITFGGKIIEVKNRLEQTPLTPEELRSPFAWRPMVKKLWEVVKDRSFQAAGGAINGYKWADPSVYQAYQEVTTAYLHSNGDSAEIWLKIEFSPWVDFLKATGDEDHDGVREVFGKLTPGIIPKDSLKKAAVWLRGDYSQRLLGREETVDWVTDLASYWYPTKNTDLVDMTGLTAWPDAKTEKNVVGTMAGVVIKNPIAVVKGKPFDPKKPIYNVYVVSTDTGTTDAQPSPVAKSAEATRIDTVVSENFRENLRRFAQEIQKYGDYTAWSNKNVPFSNGLASFIGKLPVPQMAFAGRDNWLFFRKSVDYVLSGDLSKQPADKNPLPPIVAFNGYLKKNGVSMLFVPVPCKEEVYYDKLPGNVPAPAISIVNPFGRKELSDLQAAGVEVIDLLPLFLAAKEQDKQAGEMLYQQYDTHWTTRCLEIAATAIAQRIRAYQWYGAMEKTTYTVIDTTISRTGDLVDKLPESERAAFAPAALKARQVRMPGGKPYIGTRESPLLLIGDSFTGVFESVDCKSAGVGAHLAAGCGLGVEIITSWGGGPLVRKKAMAARAKDLPMKKVVIYMMADRDLYNYQLGWEKFPE